MAVIERINVGSERLCSWGITANEYKMDDVQVDFQDLLVNVAKLRATKVEAEIQPLSKRIRARNSLMDNLGEALSALSGAQAAFTSSSEGSATTTVSFSANTVKALKACGQSYSSGSHELTKRKVEELVQLVKSKIDSFNNQSQTDMTRLQSLVDRRDQSFSAESVAVLTTREPGGTRLAELIRGLVRDEVDDPPVTRSEVLLFLAARAQVVSQVIKPALARGEWVLCDRFADSTFAYQGYGRGIDVKLLRQLNEFATEGLTPDLTILLDVPLETSRARLAERQAATATSADRIEQAGEMFHRRLREGFLELAKAEPERFVVIDSSGAREEVSKKVRDAVLSLEGR